MASSVASASEMERWARDRREAKQRQVYTKQADKRDFSSFNPDFESLQTFERKAQQLAEKQEARENGLEVVPVINVMGSTAGSGSGDFHTYRGYRTKEMARQADFARERKEEAERKEWEAQRAEAAAEAEAKHAKGSAKRDKKKEKRKAAIEAERAEREAKRAARAADGEGGGGKGGGGEVAGA